MVLYRYTCALFQLIYEPKFWFQLSRLSVESMTPSWNKASDLRTTRISNHSTHEVLIFKEVEWLTLRAEAGTNADSPTPGYNINAPLRLITSHGRTRIALKKSTHGIQFFLHTFLELCLKEFNHENKQKIWHKRESNVFYLSWIAKFLSKNLEFSSCAQIIREGGSTSKTDQRSKIKVHGTGLLENQGKKDLAYSN